MKRLALWVLRLVLILAAGVAAAPVATDAAVPLLLRYRILRMPPCRDTFIQQVPNAAAHASCAAPVFGEVVLVTALFLMALVFVLTRPLTRQKAKPRLLV